MGARLDSYNLGKKLANIYKNEREAFCDINFMNLIGWDRELSYFFTAGFNNAEIPSWITGWRYGNIPAEGRSKNYKDDTMEEGVSMMEVTKKDGTILATQDLISKLWIESDCRKVVKCEGWLNTWTTGSDGEPLLFSVGEI